MTPALARRIALATLESVFFDVVADATLAGLVRGPASIDYGYDPVEIAAAQVDRAEMARLYQLTGKRPDIIAATLAARQEWLMRLPESVPDPNE